MPITYSTYVRRFGDSTGISGVNGVSTLLHDNSGFAEFSAQGDTATIYKPIYANVQGYEYYLEDEIPSSAEIVGLEYKFQISLPSIPWETWKFQATPILGAATGNSMFASNGNNTLGGPNDLLGLSPTVTTAGLNLGIKFTLTVATGITNGNLRLLGNTFSSGTPTPKLTVYWTTKNTRATIEGSTKVSITGPTKVVLQSTNS